MQPAHAGARGERVPYVQCLVYHRPHMPCIHPLRAMGPHIAHEMTMLCCAALSGFQVESIAQLGVYLLLFSLGMELSIARVRSVLGVSIVGGSLQIFLSMLAGALVSVYMCDSHAAPGAFVGALLAMSSTRHVPIHRAMLC